MVQAVFSKGREMLEDTEFEYLGEASLIWLAEVTEVVKTLFSFKAPGVDEIPPRDSDGSGHCWAV